MNTPRKHVWLVITGISGGQGHNSAIYEELDEALNRIKAQHPHLQTTEINTPDEVLITGKSFYSSVTEWARFEKWMLNI